MNKKGFSLVELIAVVAILGLIIVLVVPSLTKSSASSKQKIYDTKMESVKNGAIEYAEDNYRILIDNAEKRANDCHNETESGITYAVCKLKFKSLVPQYIVADREGEEAISKGLLEDPRDTSKNLDNDIVKIKINKSTRKITAEISSD